MHRELRVECVHRRMRTRVSLDQRLLSAEGRLTGLVGLVVLVIRLNSIPFLHIVFALCLTTGILALGTLSLSKASSLKLLVDVRAGVGFVVEASVKLKGAPPTGHSGLNATSSVLILTVFFIIPGPPIAEILA